MSDKVVGSAVGKKSAYNVVQHENYWFKRYYVQDADTGRTVSTSNSRAEATEKAREFAEKH